MFHHLSFGGYNMVVYCIQVKSAIPYGPTALASYSFKVAWVLHFAVFLAGLWYDCTAMCCSNVSSDCSTCSLFNILCNRKLMNEGTATTAAAKLLQLCPTLCDPTDGSPPGSLILGILQARTLEWVAISFSNAWKWKLKGKSLSRVRLFATPWTASLPGSSTTNRCQNTFWDAYRHLCMDLCKMGIVLCCQGQNFELVMRKPDFCLSHLISLWLWARDVLYHGSHLFN